MQKLTRSEINIRAALYIAIAVLSFLMASETFARVAGDVGVMCAGAVNAALLAWRVFIDRTSGQGETAPAPQEPTAAKDGDAA